MSLPDRKEAEVRRLLEGPHPPVPAELATQAAELGLRMLRRRQAARRLMWLVILAATVAFTVWAARVHPWTAPPSTVAPPVDGF
ncbi:hypothetical protein [Streptomyces sp. CBMA152]|uniref:hypothetical protein n=1 Tax=Streptomyces sp. CBMA152 TaxID=1896312 RepID=UPI00166170CD|nr:hypothetical protein [Streptomyces sp. CBMA152]MBD0745369.1 hypothetical protein [Streptomyces sp. CBMA152]